MFKLSHLRCSCADPMWGLKAAKLCSAPLPNCFYLLGMSSTKVYFFFDKKHVFFLFSFPQKSFSFYKKHVFSLFNFPQKSFFLTKNTYFSCLIFKKSHFFWKIYAGRKGHFREHWKEKKTRKEKPTLAIFFSWSHG